MDKSKLSVIDLFCGAGGFSTGFLMTRAYVIKAGVDNEGSMEKSFTQNHPGSTFFQRDIRKSPPEEILEINPDLVIGSPPCQGFSDARGIRYRLDRKNDLVFRYFEWIDQIRPKIALMENVKGMSTIGQAWRSLEHPEREENIDFMTLLEETASEIDYSFDFNILNSKDFGVPQERERVFCIMIRKDLGKNLSLPKPTHGSKHKENRKQLDEFLGINNQESKKDLLPFVTTREALYALPDPCKYETGNSVDVLSPYNCELPKKMTWFQNIIFNNKVITNHVARYPKNNDEFEIIKRIPEGITFRSDRLGDKHIGVWDLFKDQLKEEERKLLKDIAALRTKNHVKTKKGRHTEGYVPIRFLEEEGHSRETIEKLTNKKFLKHPTSCILTEKAEIILKKRKDSNLSFSKQTTEYMVTKTDLTILEKLLKLQFELKDSEFVRDYQLGVQPNTLKKLVRFGWINTGKIEGEYDLTAKAGLRGKFSRIALDQQSRTLMTGFSSPREILHPTKNRGLSLREGARLMSFPDSFTFYGSFPQISLQIGNAVAPFAARIIALEISKVLS